MRVYALSPAAVAAVVLACGLGACTTAGDGPSGSGFAETFNADNYRRTDNTNGTQNRPDVNRAFTQPTLPTIGNRGY